MRAWPGTGAQPEALIKEARRRQRRRYLAVGAAVAAVLGSAAGLAAGLGGPAPHSHAGPQVATGPAAGALAPIPRSLGTTVLMWPAGTGQCCGPVAVDNLGTGQLAQSQEPDISVGDYQPLLTQVGGWLVYVGTGATAIRDDLSGKPRVLGPPRAVPSSAAYLFARTAWSARGSWLLYQGPGGHLWAYQVTSGKTGASSTPCCQYTVMVAAPSDSG